MYTQQQHPKQNYSQGYANQQTGIVPFESYPPQQQYYDPQAAQQQQNVPQAPQQPYPSQQQYYDPQAAQQQQYVPQAPQQPYEPNQSSRFKFSKKSVRMAFVRKVYGILSIQIMATIGVVCLMMFTPPIRRFVLRYWWLYWVALGMTLVLMFTLVCVTNIRRTFPLNVIMLGLFTLVEGFLVGSISIRTKGMFVLYATLITLGIVIVITIFAFQTKIDFTYLSGFLIICSLVLFVFGIMAAVMRIKILYTVYCCVGVLLFSAFLLVDTQLMLGGNHKYSISPEEYVFAALNLYIDIMQIFLMILGIFSSTD